MMRIEILADGQVVNTIIAASLEAAQALFGAEHCRAAAVQDPDPTPIVPTVLTMRQARLVIREAGYLDAIATAINSLPSPQKEKAQIEWEYSNEVQRHNGFVSQLAPALGLTSEQVDALFVTGAAL